MVLWEHFEVDDQGKYDNRRLTVSMESNIFGECSDEYLFAMQSHLRSRSVHLFARFGGLPRF